jgi:hypothetical protein
LKRLRKLWPSSKGLLGAERMVLVLKYVPASQTPATASFPPKLILGKKIQIAVMVQSALPVNSIARIR